MGQNLSPSLIHQLEGRYVRPSFLAELVYGEGVNDVWRWSSNGTVYWNSKTWTEMGIVIEGISWETRLSTRATMSIQNLDSVIASIVLNTVLADRNIDIYLLYQYDRNIFYSDIVNISGASTLTITQPIPSDVAQTGTIYIGAPVALTGTSSTSYSYTSWSGRTFVLSTPLVNTVPAGMTCYLLKSSYELTDAVQVFSGVVDDTTFNEKMVSMNLIPESTTTQFTPRRYINKNNGFNFLPQTGLKIHWGNEIFTLERAKY